jgi:hypothetical protein
VSEWRELGLPWGDVAVVVVATVDFAAAVAEDELREKLRLGGIRRYEDVAAGHHAANVTRPTTAGALSVIPRREP